MSVCILVSEDQEKVQKTARRLLRNGIYRTYRPLTYSRFFNRIELGMRTYALDHTKEDFELLRATCNRAILDIAQVLNNSNYQSQYEFVTLVGHGLTSYRFETIEIDDARVDCQLTGKSIRKENAVGLRIWSDKRQLPIKRRFCDVFDQSKKLLESNGDEAFIEFVDENIDSIFGRNSKLYYVSKKRLKFVKALLKLSSVDLFIDSWSVLWVDAHDKDPDKAIALLSDSVVESFVAELRSAYELIVTQTRKKSS